MEKLEGLERVRTICLVMLTIVATGFALYWLKPVLIPFILALFFTYLLTPIIDFLIIRLRTPRWVAFAASLVVTVLVLTLVGVLVSSTVSRATRNSDLYREQFENLLEKATQKVPFEKLGFEQKDLRTTLLEIPEETMGSILGGVAGEVVNVLSNGLLVLIFTIFLLIGKTYAKNPQKGGPGGEIEQSIKRYIVLKVLISVATGVLHGLVLMAFGIEFAWVFAFATFLLNFIPNIGSVIATLLPIPAFPLTPELSLTGAALAIAIPAVIQFSIGNLIEPRLMGDSLDLHPIVVLMGLIFFGTIWGIAGMFLATPITAAVKILFQKSEVTAPIANALAGRLDEWYRDHPPPETGPPSAMSDPPDHEANENRDGEKY